MATVEFLMKRVDGKKAEIAKLESKLARIRKAEATNWEVNPYYYDEGDLRWTKKYLADAVEALAKYEEQLEQAKEKENSRDVEVIVKFLENWQERMMAFYKESLPKYLDARNEYHMRDHEICNLWNSGNREEYKKARVEFMDWKKAFNFQWSYIIPYVERETLDETKLAADLKKEANAKYDDIIERTNSLVGQITDASGLRIGAKGDLNGIIVGTKGSVNVNTIGAGGYNIQCYHFRTLIHKLQ